MALFLLFFGLYLSLVFDAIDVSFQRTVVQGLKSHLDKVRGAFATAVLPQASCVSSRFGRIERASLLCCTFFFSLVPLLSFRRLRYHPREPQNRLGVQ